MQDLSGPGLEPTSPALEGGFLTTAPPGKPIRERFLSLFREGGMNTEEWSERCKVVGFEDGGRSHEPRNTGSLQKLEKAKKQTLP